MWQLFKEYFSFTKKERKGILIVVLSIFFISLLPEFFHFFVKDEPLNTTEFEKAIAALKADSLHSNSYSKKEDE